MRRTLQSRILTSATATRRLHIWRNHWRDGSRAAMSTLLWTARVLPWTLVAARCLARFLLLLLVRVMVPVFVIVVVVLGICISPLFARDTRR